MGQRGGGGWVPRLRSARCRQLAGLRYSHDRLTPHMRHAGGAAEAECADRVMISCSEGVVFLKPEICCVQHELERSDLGFRNLGLIPMAGLRDRLHADGEKDQHRGDPKRAEIAKEMILRICRLQRNLKQRELVLRSHLLVAEGCQRFKQFIDRSHK